MARISGPPPPTAKLPGLIPMRDFFRNQEITGLKIAPDGHYISYLKSWKNRLNIHVLETETEIETRLTASTQRDIMGYMWANNDRVAFVQDTGGDENYRLFAVNTDGSDLKELTPFDQVQVTIVDELENQPDEMLIKMNKRDPKVFDVYRINIVSGEMKIIAENPGNITFWGTDHEGKLRVATSTDGVNNSILYRETEDKPFQTLLTTNFKEQFSPLFFTYDNQRLYVASNIGRDTTAIYEYDPQTKQKVQLIYEHPEVDVTHLIRSDKQKRILGASYITDKVYNHFFDEEREQLQRDLEARLPGYQVTIVNKSKDEQKLLVVNYSDKSYGAYYYYDLETREFKKLGEVSPWLDETEMADMSPISFTSRDGLTIHGYLTLPRGVEPMNLPVVVNPHGGPYHRDIWYFNPEVQFLANRGYAVLQVNFRGSTGYGRKFWTASFKQWGRKMQDDITDGVKWLIDQRLADPERIGIYGCSFGGYATLAGLVSTPELYACGVDYVGVSNIFSWMKSFPPYWQIGLEMLYEMVGHPVKEKDLLEKISPVFHVDRIKAPLLIAQGANDPRVPKAESDQMVQALNDRGIEVPYLVKENEGHGFQNEENRFDFYRIMERFLGKHLGGRVEKE